MKSLIDFLYKLFFTRDDDLDTLQVLFAAIVIVTLVITWVVTTGGNVNDTVKIEGMVTLRWLTGLLVVTAVPKWLVPFIVQNKKNVDSQVFTPPTNNALNSEYVPEMSVEPTETDEHSVEENR